MSIGILCSGFEALSLMQILNQYDHHYHIRIDRAHQPRGKKSQELQTSRITTGLAYLTETANVDYIIVPPLYEDLSHHESIPPTYQEKILPLRSNYVSTALQHSLVGKIGLMGQTHTQIAPVIISHITKKQYLTPNQSKTKKFHQDRPHRIKSLPMRESFMSTYSRTDRMVRKTIKHDLRYFKDAGVDTLIPLCRSFLWHQKVINQLTNRKKIRYHGSDVVKFCRENICTEKQTSSDTYAITLHTTDTPTPILQEKKWMMVLSKGGEVEVDIERTSLSF